MRSLILLFTLANLSQAQIVGEVQEAISRNDFGLGESRIKAYRNERGVTPEMLEALSWMARGALQANQLDQAEAYATQTRELTLGQLKRRPLDAEPHLPIALGAAIEVSGKVMNARGERADALLFLRKELLAYRATSIRTRIQKNINLIDMVGKPAPALDERVFLGPKPQPLAALKGKPVLLFFWAHWCGDCKGQRRELSLIKNEYGPKGLVLMGPTKRYGYVEGGETAKPDQELKYIDEVRHKYYADLIDMPAPVSENNLKTYGASSTPTIVLIDRQGIVRLYHPGRMTLEELEQALRGVV